MNPISQTIFNGGNPPPGEECGNCFAACVASILELDLDTVPNFCNTRGKNGEWWDRFNAWMREATGLVPMMIESLGHIKPGYTIMCGPGPRGHVHSVVAYNGEMVHDPHPSGDGLLDTEDHTVFIALAPDRWVVNKPGMVGGAS